ncbi:nuclear receptor-interacting protein 1 [Thalassophryne amazonica]|uniref:nuclear receptor-interacting protein 1 n=1 Tax=Thalassophryne amazonica TaxID=390379 RepID=UPI001470A290|nr:nuclear receptor-interacting protein 1 [Thalassophryne amazonica]XP_034034834.1 nuclear receptor-interacting protein 1 [Thalassophryne amazonica]XP_034034835.1 nuclear receptor-interacting protein 1 [Thalassophryne amazonica]XP_034034836.1 nuclear receptor-interacting protein 1 [Thalassophryne amazonica]
MTHGEEPGPETHKDSAVLTYLEGLLMHPVVAGPGATASGRSEGACNNQEQVDKAGGPFQLPNHGPSAPKAGTNGPTMGTSQHLKKARLLSSGAWNDTGDQRMSSPSLEVNGQGGVLQNGTPEGSPHAGESTLLASLLQSFSSRLQSVAMSQHSNKSPSESSVSKEVPADKERHPVYGTASSRLKGLMRKSKLQNHSSTPYSRRERSQDRPPESPRSAHSATPPSVPTAAESVSCADRLKAVANMVKIRSSPAPSPKPSVACSQLALLLSSEAHLQQYSREHALKAQLSGQSASERLAAMANQQHGQDKRPPSVGGTMPETPEPLSSLTTQNGMTTTTITAALPTMGLPRSQSTSLLHGHSQSSPPTPPHAVSHSHPPREKRGFDSRPTRPPQTCSSLLLLLLNNHNNQKQLTKNGHLEDSCGILPLSGSSSVTSDSECSTQERSLAKDSDAESSYSSCSPIDLSVRSRPITQETGPKTATPSSSFSSSSNTHSSSTAVFASTPNTFSPRPSTQPSTTAFSPVSALVSSVSTDISSPSSSSFSTSSLDKLTETLINKWKPEPSGLKASKRKEPETTTNMKSHPKVTLMQLLLERRNNEKVNKSAGNQDMPVITAVTSMSRGHSKGLVPWEEVRTKSPVDRPVRIAQPHYSLSRDPGGSLSPYSYPSPHGQSSPLDLCKSKAFPTEKASEPAFSASKLLQNLAQCGTASSSPPTPSNKGLSQETDAGRPLALLERLNAPIHRITTTPLSDRLSGGGTPVNRKEDSPPSSQIENLLERRTVLQLLLGTSSATSTSSHKDRPGGSVGSVEMAGGCFDKSPGASSICDSSNGPSLDVKIKTELVEEVEPSSAISEDMCGRKRSSDYGKSSPNSVSQQHMKTEPRPAEVIAKYGLLSQLLKQQTATYYTNSVMHAASQTTWVKDEPREYPSPSPKKRRVCSDRTENSSSPRAADSGDTSSFMSSVVQEEPELQRSLKEDAPSRNLPNNTPNRESRGFNVLKQLLLSDNCLKDLSQQPRVVPSPPILQANGSANGSILNQPTQNHNFLHLPWQPHGSISSGLSSHLRPLPMPPSSDGPVQPLWGCHSARWPGAQKRDPASVVKQEPGSPVRWSVQEKEEEKGCDSNPDSPRLSRSNPILYYMLQQGSVQLRKEVKEQAEEAQPVVVRVKEEPDSDMHAYEHSLSSTPQSPTTHTDKHSRENQGLSQSTE